MKSLVFSSLLLLSLGACAAYVEPDGVAVDATPVVVAPDPVLVAPPVFVPCCGVYERGPVFHGGPVYHPGPAFHPAPVRRHP